MAIRLLWVFPFTYLPRLLRRPANRPPSPPWRNVLIVGWTGMRGAVSLAAALALPLVVDGGAAFPQRDLIIFLAFSVILDHPARPGLHPAAADPAARRRRHRRGAGAGGARGAPARRGGRARPARGADRRGLGHATTPPSGCAAPTATGNGGSRPGSRTATARAPSYEERSESYQRLTRELLEAQRAILISMRNDGEINDTVLRILERELDLEDSRLEI